MAFCPVFTSAALRPCCFLLLVPAAVSIVSSKFWLLTCHGVNRVVNDSSNGNVVPGPADFWPPFESHDMSFQSPVPAVLLTLTDPPPFHLLHAEREAGVGAEQLGR